VEIDNHMVAHGFVNIDATNLVCAMFEMFLMIFVKKELAGDVTKVVQTHIEKGFMGVVGNKGCVAYSFKLKNRLFNVIGTHLRHGQN
jgi:hypothetical protein